MQAGDITNQGSEPWANRRYAIPKRTWTGKVVYPHAPSRRHFWKVEDVQRIIAKLYPPETGDGPSWAQHVIRVLKDATMTMLDRILFFLPDSAINTLYDWCIGILDKLFRVETDSPTLSEGIARQIIIYAADRAGLTVTIKK